MEYDIWFLNIGDPEPSFISEKDSVSRPDEQHFVSALPDSYIGQGHLRANLYDIKWVNKYPNFSRKPDAATTLDTEAAAKQAEQVRLDDIKTEQVNAGLKDITITQAYNYIDNQLDAATDLNSLKETIKTILKKMIPYILR